MALAPAFCVGARSLCSSGTRNAAVLPLPVLAMATTSRPLKITGMVWNRNTFCLVHSNTFDQGIILRIIFMRFQSICTKMLFYLSLDGCRDSVPSSQNSSKDGMVQTHGLKPSRLVLFPFTGDIRSGHLICEGRHVLVTFFLHRVRGHRYLHPACN